MADTFGKRQRAQKKKDKKREKRERKQERAANGGTELTEQDINRMYFDDVPRDSDGRDPAADGDDTKPKKPEPGAS